MSLLEEIRKPLHDEDELRKPELTPVTRKPPRARARRPKVSKASDYRGVYPVKSGRWIAILKVASVRHHIGTYETQEEAARAYDAKAAELLGDKAILNFPWKGDS